MAIITLVSVSGAPGVTSTALALALSWPRPVLLVDADPAATNAIAAGYLKGQALPVRSMIDLAIAHRNGQLAESLPGIWETIPGTTVLHVPGLRQPEQATSMRQIWPELLTCLDELDQAGTDTIIDAGRLSAENAPLALLDGADVTLLTSRTTLPAVAACTAWLPRLRQIVPEGARARLCLCLIGAGRPYTTRDFTGVVPLPVAAEIALDPVSAEVFSLGAKPGRGFETGPLRRSVKAAAATIEHLAREQRADLQASQDTP